MSTWNFLEAAHGKGPADGIGAAVKRAADQAIIVKELDITCAKDFINLIQDTTSVKLFLIPQEKICEIDEDVPENLSPLQGTMKIHQLVLEEPHSFTSRVLSCFCEHPTKLQCNCFKPDVHTVPQLKVTMSELIEKNVDVVQLNKVSVVEENLIGRYVVVQYDGLPFPGVILDVDEDEIEVKAMHRVGNNRYFWPMIDDVLWYNKEQVLTHF
ncbi:uncharacterized protein LOC132727272 [Ruditapes philippinarum]|uniref:uncharacterized protein LOC132727272 n=1 Tax=Ruditapes philippinarum TaxID=129788 RepID=UPI00295BB6C6|nr:uncharacterized protein LOC132727272 [Ruditapes philippinarum]